MRKLFFFFFNKSTLGTVRSGYPVDKVVDEINLEIPRWQSSHLNISSFFMVTPFKIFFSSNFSKNNF
jgi:hypothetical protein